MLLVLLLAVLVPTACVLWFMTAAMRNVHLVVRQRLADAYRQRLVEARKLLEGHFSDKPWRRPRKRRPRVSSPRWYGPASPTA